MAVCSASCCKVLSVVENSILRLSLFDVKFEFESNHIILVLDLFEFKFILTNKFG